MDDVIVNINVFKSINLLVYYKNIIKLNYNLITYSIYFILIICVKNTYTETYTQTYTQDTHTPHIHTNTQSKYTYTQTRIQLNTSSIYKYYVFYKTL